MTGILTKSLSQHTAIVGKTGSGKTVTAKGIIEFVATESHVCILDPIKSDWWGLTLDKDGKGRGLPLDIIGGPYGHVPLHADAGKALGQVVGSGELRHSIIDMADFGPGDLHRFYVPFAEALFKSKTPDSGVLYLVLEEAHVFCPKERDGVKDENMGIFWTKRLASAARTKGVRLVVVTQRTQALHNAVLGSCDTIIPHRLTLPADQKPIVDWLKGNVDAEKVGEVASSLSSLRTGEGWVISGEAKIVKHMRFPMIRTYDNSATPTGAGTKAARPQPVDQDRLRAIIGTAVAEAEANDPKKLRAEIAALKLAANKHQAPPVPPVDVNAIVARAQSECRAAFAPIVKSIGDALGRARGDIESMERQLGAIHTLMNTAAPQAVTRTASAPIVAATTNRVPPTDDRRAADGLTRTQQRVIDAVAMWTSIGTETPTIEQVAFVAKINPYGGHFSNTIGPISTLGYIKRTNGQVHLTASGRGVANWPKSAMTLAEYHDNMRSLLKSGAQIKILDAVISAGGQSVTVEAIGVATGIDPSGGHFSNSIGPLSTLGLVRRSRGTVEPTELLFPKGLQ